MMMTIQPFDAFSSILTNSGNFSLRMRSFDHITSSNLTLYLNSEHPFS